MAQAALTTPLVGPLSYRDLCAQTVDVASTIRWCQSLKLLRSNLMCSCGRGMNLVEREMAGKEGVLWRCPRKRCRREVSLRKDTFFEGSHLEIEDPSPVVHQDPFKQDEVEVEISRKTAVDWYNFVRDVCAQYYIDHPAVIGEPNVEVEIDESKFGKRKYNRGRTVDGHWVFGNLQNFVRPGSIVYSDEWAAYNQLAATAACQHQTVNHSIHFVDPQTGTHTQDELDCGDINQPVSCGSSVVEAIDGDDDDVDDNNSNHDDDHHREVDGIGNGDIDDTEDRSLVRV
ncbi:hypothetical protein EMCRGX_G018164 [Ephydatia muelleri]